MSEPEQPEEASPSLIGEITATATAEVTKAADIPAEEGPV